jgi:hypothetical protein
MSSESARMNSAAEAQFRIQGEVSAPRTVKVIALDEPSERVVRRLAKDAWNRTTFLTAAAISIASPMNSEFAVTARLSDLTGKSSVLSHEIDTADLVVMVATPGGGAYAASIIGEECSLRRVTTTGVVIGGISAPEAAVSKTLSQLRPWSLMVVIADPEDYLDHMLAALRA